MVSLAPPSDGTNLLLGWRPEPAVYEEDHTVNYRWLPAYRLQGMQDTISRARLSPDSQTVAAAAADGWLKAWDAQTAQSVLSVRAHEKGINDVTFDKSGRFLFTASSDTNISVFDIRQGPRPAFVLENAHECSVMCIATPHAEDSLFLSGGYDERLKIWDVRARACMQSEHAHMGPISSLEVSRDDRVAVTASFDGHARFWHCPTLRGLKTFALRPAGDHPPLCQALFCAPGERYVLAFNFNRTAKVFDTVNLAGRERLPLVAANLQQVPPPPRVPVQQLLRNRPAKTLQHPYINAYVNNPHSAEPGPAFGCAWRGRAVVPGLDGHVYGWECVSGLLEFKLPKVHRGNAVTSVDVPRYPEATLMVTSGGAQDKSVVLWVMADKEDARSRGLPEATERLVSIN